MLALALAAMAGRRTLSPIMVGREACDDCSPIHECELAWAPAR